MKNTLIFKQYPITPKYTLDEIEGLAEHQLPAQFLGKESIDTDFISAFRSEHHTFAWAQSAWALLPCPSLNPLVTKFHARVLQCSDQAVRRIFLDEISRHFIADNCSPAWLIFANFRYTMAISKSKISQEEIDFYVDLNLSGLMLGLMRNNAWKNEYTALASAALLDDGAGGTNYVSDFDDRNAPRSLNYEFKDLLEQLVDYITPVQIYYPIYDLEHLGVSFLTRSFIEKIFPISFPNKKVTAHGVKMSPFSFAYHDALHGSRDKFKSAFSDHILGMVRRAINQDAEPFNFLASYVPIAVKRYHALKGLLLLTYRFLLSNVLANYGKEIFLQDMATLFLVIHEGSNYTSSMFHCNDIEEIFNKLTSGDSFNEDISNEDSSNEVIDPYHTCPVTGISPLTDHKIAQLAYREIFPKINKYSLGLPNDSYIWSKTKLKKHLFDLISWEVSRNSASINVEFRVLDGSVLIHRELTLKTVWGDYSNMIGLLKMAGINIPKSTLDAADVENSRKSVFATAECIDIELKKLRTGFLTRLNYHMKNTGLDQQWFNWQYDLSNKTNEKIKQNAFKKYRTDIGLRR